MAGFKGGQLLTALHNCAHHGDTTVQSVTSKLIYAAVEPLLQHIRRWIFFGQLDDKFNEVDPESFHGCMPKNITFVATIRSE